MRSRKNRVRGGLFGVLATVGLTIAASAATTLPELSDKQIEQYKDLSKQAHEAFNTSNRKIQAASLMEKALAVHGSSEGDLYNLACMWGRAGRKTEALRSLDRALAAGFTDGDWAKKDPDLKLLHGSPELEAWAERAAARAAELETASEPPAVDAATLASSNEAIETKVDADKARAKRLRGVVSAKLLSAFQRELDRWTVASWDAIAANASDDVARAEAKLAALRVLAGRSPQRASKSAAADAIERATAYLENFSDSESFADVALLQAELRFGLASRDKAENAERDAKRDFERDLLLITASHASGEATEKAMAKLVTLQGYDFAAAKRLYQRLKAVAPEGARDRLLAESAGMVYRIDGLPEFAATTVDGRSVSRADLSGKVTLVEFWATWCGPCMEELPNVKAAYEKFHQDGFDILGISLDRGDEMSTAVFQKWCADNGVAWPQIYDGKFWDAELAKLFHVKGIPFGLLVDRSGRVVAVEDELRGEMLAQKIAATLAAEGERASR